MADNEEPQVFRKRYTVEKKLGAGNFGTAYLVNDARDKKEPKVLKVVRLGEMDKDEQDDSHREAQLLSNLDNPFIVKFCESFIENDCLCIVTEFCDGGDLDQRLKELKKQKKQLDEEQIVEWLIQILIAVQYMHKSRVLHRDLKARNIFLKNNQVKIGDFGISRILVGTMDVATTFTGTPYYMSPEVMKHDGYESKSDIWSGGWLLYEISTYDHAFDGKGLMNVIYKVVEGKPPKLPRHYSKPLDDLLKKMFAKDPENRPSADDLLKTPFILEHRNRTHLNGPLEGTVNAKTRLGNINTQFEERLTLGEMRESNWQIRGKGWVMDDVQEELPASHQEEEEERTLRDSHPFRTGDRRGQGSPPSNPNRAIGREKPIAKPTYENYDERPIPTRAQTNRFEDRPITPMQKSYEQWADEDSEGNFALRNDRSPTRTMKSGRQMSASQQSTMNSMSRTLHPQKTPNVRQDMKNISPAKTLGSAPRPKTGSKPSTDDTIVRLRDNPNIDPFGPKAKESKINQLRARAIRDLGEATFQRVYDYYVTQRTAQKNDPSVDEARIAEGLTAIAPKTNATFLVDQLVFLEMF